MPQPLDQPPEPCVEPVDVDFGKPAHHRGAFTPLSQRRPGAEMLEHQRALLGRADHELRDASPEHVGLANGTQAPGDLARVGAQARDAALVVHAWTKELERRAQSTRCNAHEVDAVGLPTVEGGR
jgi:hypothetical protein